MPMYTSYRKQYTFGQVPFELKKLDTQTPAPAYLGSGNLETATGNKFANLSKDTDDATHTMPICLKAEGQAAFEKIRLDVKVLETLAGSGAAATVTIGTCGDDANGDADISNVETLLKFPLSTAGTPVASAMPFMEIGLPSNTKTWVYVSVVLDDKTKAFTAGKIMIHMNPSL